MPLLVTVLITTLAFLAAVLASALAPISVWAQEEQRAGLVVVYGDGRVEQQCVALAEESISGYELLQAAGITLSVEAGAIGTTVCSIGGEGCSYPQESCFCRCQGSPCVYWSYWRLQDDGAWRYQVLGAGNTQVRNGDVEGWRWAEGTTRNAEEPPQATFAEVCGETQPATKASSATTPEAAPGAALETAPKTTPKTTPEGAAETAMQPTADPNVRVGEPSTALLPAQPMWLLLGAVTLLPAALLVSWALWRRGRHTGE
jgi:hypothetical protein